MGGGAYALVGILTAAKMTPYAGRVKGAQRVVRQTRHRSGDRLSTGGSSVVPQFWFANSTREDYDDEQ